MVNIWPWFSGLVHTVSLPFLYESHADHQSSCHRSLHDDRSICMSTLDGQLVHVITL